MSTPYQKNTIFAPAKTTRRSLKYADIAQLVEQLICNQPVVGSSPTIGSRHKRETIWESSRAVKWDRL